MAEQMTALHVFWVACTVALFQGLGAIPLWLFDEMGLSVSSYLIVMASGMMVGTGFILLLSALTIPPQFTLISMHTSPGDFSWLIDKRDNRQVFLGLAIGWALVHFAAHTINSWKSQPTASFKQQYSEESTANSDSIAKKAHSKTDTNEANGNDPLMAWITGTGENHALSDSTSQMLVVILTMFIHSLGEGASIGVSFGMDEMASANENDANHHANAHATNSDGANGNGGILSVSQTVVWSLCIHNIPEGLATCLFLVSRGMSKRQAAIWSVFCDVPLPFTAVPAFLFVDYFEPLLTLSIGFAAGAMFYVSFVELIPECLAIINAKHTDALDKKTDGNEAEMRKLKDANLRDKLVLVSIFVCSVVLVFFMAD